MRLQYRAVATQVVRLRSEAKPVNSITKAPELDRQLYGSRIDRLLAPGPDLVVSPDMGCLIHQKGLAQRAGRPYPARHVAQVLRDAAAAP